MKELGTSFTDLVAGPIANTWDYIASDVIALERECGNRGDPSPKLIIEMCIDAGRLAECGGKNGPTADRAIEEAIDSFGYDVVLKYLAKTVGKSLV